MPIDLIPESGLSTKHRKSREKFMESATFNEQLYLATFPDLVGKVKSGEYTSGLDYYTKVGQFEGDDLTEGFFTGTSGNDTVSGFGADKDLYGIGYKEITIAEDGTVTLTPESLGVGEIDVLIGSEGFDGNYLATYNSFNFETLIADTEQLYVGQGDKDYALIKNLDPSDGYITISTADLTDFDYKVDDQGFKIYKGDDLVGIAEGIYDLQIGFFEPSLELAALSKTTEAGTATGGFDEDLYLLSTPDAAKAVAEGVFKTGLEYYVQVGQYTTNAEGEPGEGFFTGTSGNDFVIGFGASAGLSGVGITAIDPSAGSYSYDSLGVGEVDTLIGGSAENRFLLGTITNPGTPETKPFYVGKGDEDYAVIKNFSKGDTILLAGAPEDYTYEDVDGNLHIAYDGDLVAIAEGISYGDLEVEGLFPESGIFLLGGASESSAPVFGTTQDDTLDLSGINQLIFAGAGNDLLDATASGGGNRVYGGSGNDTFILGKGDSLIGDIGDDRFFVQTGGDNLLKGGAGADQFWIATAELPTAVNTIADFTPGEDVIGLAGVGASFGALTLTQQADNALVAFGENELAILNGIQTTSLSAENFAFA
jgi:Ca2+-binding RTX toxin-like protein